MKPRFLLAAFVILLSVADFGLPIHPQPTNKLRVRTASHFRDGTDSAKELRIAVAPFTSRSADTSLGPLIARRVAEEARRGLDGTRRVTILSGDTLDIPASGTKHHRSTEVDAATAIGIGKRYGALLFVSGTIDSVVTEYPAEAISAYEEEADIPAAAGAPARKAKARVTVVNRGAIARCYCRYRIVETTRGMTVKSGDLPGIRTVEIVFGWFKGDEAALSARSKALCDRGESYPPRREELIQEAADSAARALAAEIVSAVGGREEE